MENKINRRTFLTGFAAAGFLALRAPQISLASETDATFGEIRSKIIKAVESGSPPSMAVAVAKDGKVLWKEAFGWANRERRVAATADTKYRIASISKPLTALGVMVLVERGRLKLDDPAGKYLGDIKLTARAGDASAVTIRHLLQHTAGLPRHWRNFYADEKDAMPDLRETVSRYGIVVSQPGSEHIYSNLGYALLARIVERVSGTAFAEFMRREVFLPLNLSDTTIENGAAISPSVAVSYDAGGAAIPFYRTGESGSMSAAASVTDLINFGMFHLKKPLQNGRHIVKSETLDRMKSDKFVTGGDSFYSLGWLGREKSAHSYYTLAHSGDAPGISALLMILPTERIAIATVANARFADLIYTVADDALDALLPANKKMRESDPSNQPPTETAAPLNFPENMRGEWVGEITTYNGKIPLMMRFQPDGTVHVKLDGQFETILTNIALEDGKISGRCHGTITTADAMRRPHQLRFVLKHENDSLSGTVHAQSSIGAVAKNTPPRDHFALASWAHLVKKK